MIQITLSTILIGLMAGCRDSADQKGNQHTSKENPEMEIENDGERQAMPEDAAGVGPAARTGGSTGASNTLKMGTENAKPGSGLDLDALYKRLEMTEGQIDEFKNAMGADLNNLQNTSGEIPGNIYEDMESQLQSILDESQLDKYREWKKER